MSSTTIAVARTTKATEVSWLNEIPTEWRERAIKRLFRQSKRRGFPEREVLSVYRDYGVIPKSSRDDNHNKTPEDVSVYQRVDKGDLVINKMKAWQGSLGVSLNDGITSPDYVVYEPLHQEHSRFIHYLLRAEPMPGVYRSISNGIRLSQWRLEPGNFESLVVPLPPVDEQKQIAAFLDYETGKIDALIEKQQQLIALLGEKRQAVISHAVTKGLNPDAPMRDSGIEWLGEVPEHWTPYAMKHLCEVRDGTHGTPSYVDPSDDAVPLVTSKDFAGPEIDFKGAKWISRESHREIIKRSLTELGDVLMSMIGGNIGKALIVCADADFSIKNVALFKTRGNFPLANYILYYLQSGLLDIQIATLSRGGAQGFLGLGDIRNLVLPGAPADEIKNVVEHLETRVLKLDELVDRANDQTELLQERRTALISAAVTGKIDVRGWKPPSSDAKSETEMEVA